MNEKVVRKNQSLRDLIYFPVVFNVVGILAIGLLFAFSPEHSADPGTINTVALTSLFLPWWLLVSIVIRRLRRKGVSINEFVVPKRRFNLIPAVLVFVLLNVFFSTYMVVSLTYGRIPAMSDLNPLQILFFIVLVPITAGFTEELIWRGYFIDKLLATGSSEKRGIIYSSMRARNGD